MLSQIRAFSDAVVDAAADDGLARALAGDDREGLEAFCGRTYAYYEDPAHGLKLNLQSPFDLWLVLDNDGVLRAQFCKKGRIEDHSGFEFRDYFRGRARWPGARRTSHARSMSENDGNFKFAISAPVRGEGGRSLGVLEAAVAADANLGSLALDDRESISVLVAPRDSERTNDPSERYPDLVLRHPAITYGEGVQTDSTQIREVARDLSSEGSVEHELWLPPPEVRTSMHGYTDPVAEAHPDYRGDWTAGFAPVGHTGIVAIVQSREEARIVIRLAIWTAICVVPAVLLALFTAASRRLRLRRRAR